MHKEALCGRGQCVKTAQNLRKLGRFCAVFVSRAPEDGCPYEIYCQLSIENRSSEGIVIARAFTPVAIRTPKAPLCKGSWHGEAVTEGLLRGALHRKNTDSHDQFANWSRNDKGRGPVPYFHIFRNDELAMP